MNEPAKKKPFNLEKAFRTTGIIANIIISIQILSLIVAYRSFEKNNEFNKTQIIAAETRAKTENAIDAINKIYNTEFLQNYDKLNSKSSINDDETRKAFYYVLNTYYILSVVYNSGIADSTMIQKAVKDGIGAFSGYDIYTDSSQENLNPTKEEINNMLKSFK